MHVQIISSRAELKHVFQNLNAKVFTDEAVDWFPDALILCKSNILERDKYAHAARKHIYWRRYVGPPYPMILGGMS